MGSRVQPLEVESLILAMRRSAETVLNRPSGRGCTEGEDDVLVRVVQAVVASVPAVDGAGVLQVERDRLRSRAPSAPWVAELDAAQADLAEGPCVDAGRRDEPVRIEIVDAEDDPRWENWLPRARAAGIRSMLSYAMGPPDGPVGSLNLYSFTPRAFGPADRLTLEVFALQAAIGLYGASRAEGLVTALDSRDVIGQAKGILMERHHIGSDQAFAMLVEASQHANLKLRDVARWLAGQREAGESADLPG